MKTRRERMRPAEQPVCLCKSAESLAAMAHLAAHRGTKIRFAVLVAAEGSRAAPARRGLESLRGLLELGEVQALPESPFAPGKARRFGRGRMPLATDVAVPERGRAVPGLEGLRGLQLGLPRTRGR